MMVFAKLPQRLKRPKSMGDSRIIALMCMSCSTQLRSVKRIGFLAAFSCNACVRAQQKGGRGGGACFLFTF